MTLTDQRVFAVEIGRRPLGRRDDGRANDGVATLPTYSGTSISSGDFNAGTLPPLLVETGLSFDGLVPEGEVLRFLVQQAHQGSFLVSGEAPTGAERYFYRCEGSLASYDSGTGVLLLSGVDRIPDSTYLDGPAYDGDHWRVTLAPIRASNLRKHRTLGDDLPSNLPIFPDLMQGFEVRAQGWQDIDGMPFIGGIIGEVSGVLELANADGRYDPLQDVSINGEIVRVLEGGFLSSGERGLIPEAWQDLEPWWTGRGDGSPEADLLGVTFMARDELSVLGQPVQPHKMRGFGAAWGVKPPDASGNDYDYLEFGNPNARVEASMLGATAWTHQILFRRGSYDIDTDSANHDFYGGGEDNFIFNDGVPVRVRIEVDGEFIASIGASDSSASATYTDSAPCAGYRNGEWVFLTVAARGDGSSAMVADIYWHRIDGTLVASQLGLTLTENFAPMTAGTPWYPFLGGGGPGGAGDRTDNNWAFYGDWRMWNRHMGADEVAGMIRPLDPDNIRSDTVGLVWWVDFENDGGQYVIDKAGWIVAYATEAYPLQISIGGGAPSIPASPTGWDTTGTGRANQRGQFYPVAFGKDCYLELVPVDELAGDQAGSIYAVHFRKLPQVPWYIFTEGIARAYTDLEVAGDFTSFVHYSTSTNGTNPSAVSRESGADAFSRVVPSQSITRAGFGGTNISNGSEDVHEDLIVPSSFVVFAGDIGTAEGADSGTFTTQAGTGEWDLWRNGWDAEAAGHDVEGWPCLIRITANHEGIVTALVDGDQYAGAESDGGGSLKDAIRYILTQLAPNMDEASVNTDGLNRAWQRVQFATGAAGLPAREVLEWVLATGGVGMFQDENGVLQVFDADTFDPPAAPDHTFAQESVRYVRRHKLGGPPLLIDYGWGRSGISGTRSDPSSAAWSRYVGYLTEQWRSEQAPPSVPSGKRPSVVYAGNAERTRLIKTAAGSRQEATDELWRLGWEASGSLWDVGLLRPESRTVRMGQWVSVAFPRHGFDAGVTGLVLATRKVPMLNDNEVTLFLPNSNALEAAEALALDDGILRTSLGSVAEQDQSFDLDVEAYGGGGGGGYSAGDSERQGGGGGGAYAADSLTLTRGVTYTIVRGDGGISPGTDARFHQGGTDLVMAKGGNRASSGGTGGAGGLASASVGSTKFSGGNGGNRGSIASGAGGSGGGGAGPSGNGSNGTTDGNPTGGAGGGGLAGAGGQAGRQGVRSATAGSVAGGGGGGKGTNGTNAAGGNGRVVVTFPNGEGTDTTYTADDTLSLAVLPDLPGPRIAYVAGDPEWVGGEAWMGISFKGLDIADFDSDGFILANIGSQFWIDVHPDGFRTYVRLSDASIPVVTATDLDDLSSLDSGWHRVDASILWNDSEGQYELSIYLDGVASSNTQLLGASPVPGDFDAIGGVNDANKNYSFNWGWTSPTVTTYGERAEFRASITGTRGKIDAARYLRQGGRILLPHEHVLFDMYYPLDEQGGFRCRPKSGMAGPIVLPSNAAWS